MGEPAELETRLTARVLAALKSGRDVPQERVVEALQEAERERLALVDAERRAAADADAERDRLRFLAGASVVLDATLDLDVALRALAHLVLGRFGGWCIVDLAEQGGLRRAVVAHRDPAHEETAAKARSEYPARPVRGSWIGEALRTRQPLVVGDIEDEVEHRASGDPGVALARGAGIRAAMILPLVAHDEVLGLLTVASDAPHAYHSTDLESAQELARRAAVAIANARLYSERDTVARTLERGLLPPSLPELNGVELAVRYRAAGRGTEVGGDFYDAVDLGNARCAVLLGDVAGKGAAAAVTGGLVRQTARGALARGAGPATVVHDVHRTLLAETPRDAFCTLVAAELLAEGGEVGVLLANAGHPLPVVVRANGTATAVGTSGGIAGAFDEVDVGESVLRLLPGDLLVLYTDGLTEAGAPYDLLDEDDVCAIAAKAAGRSPAEAAALLERHALEHARGRQRDDLAIVVLRPT